MDGGTRVPPPGRHQTGSFGDELTNAAMIGLIGVFALALLLRGAGSVAAFLAGTAQPGAGPAAGVGVLFTPGYPATALEAEGIPTTRAPTPPTRSHRGRTTPT